MSSHQTSWISLFIPLYGFSPVQDPDPMPLFMLHSDFALVCGCTSAKILLYCILKHFMIIGVKQLIPCFYTNRFQFFNSITYKIGPNLIKLFNTGLRMPLP